MVRAVPLQVDKNGVVTNRKVQILQQWWEDEFHYDPITNDRVGEWRDVPLEEDK